MNFNCEWCNLVAASLRLPNTNTQTACAAPASAARPSVGTCIHRVAFNRDGLGVAYILFVINNLICMNDASTSKKIGKGPQPLRERGRGRGRARKIFFGLSSK